MAHTQSKEILAVFKIFEQDGGFDWDVSLLYLDYAHNVLNFYVGFTGIFVLLPTDGWQGGYLVIWAQRTQGHLQLVFMKI